MNAVASPRPQAVDPSSIFKTRYDNFIGGQWVAPVGGQYFEDTSPITGKVITAVARSQASSARRVKSPTENGRDGSSMSTSSWRILARSAAPGFAEPMSRPR